MRWGNFLGCKVGTKRGKGILKEITYNQVGIKIDGLVNTPQCEYFYFDEGWSLLCFRPLLNDLT